jgi:hypothetical protein
MGSKTMRARRTRRINARGVGVFARPVLVAVNSDHEKFFDGRAAK